MKTIKMDATWVLSGHLRYGSESTIVSLTDEEYEEFIKNPTNFYSEDKYDVRSDAELTITADDVRVYGYEKLIDFNWQEIDEDED